ncbi:hypothetical protein EV363DRAFT_1443855 [Boletus edulis]|uniref:Uncharacterized protein n=1 Tax=Boletus edulis BED1 TaxID=1328754 RepID=A0AAD4GJX9_BOLED|nr:hypothetical protein EV363DRAFT_1443855 [Boletus edulis]KAF8449356.1 hypothetical protein L210DRAFT_2660838 [Boletus edulis BED1]
MTHIILYRNKLRHKVIEAYVIPDDKETNELRLTHETITHMEEPLWWFLLRNSVVNPITGFTHLRFLLYSPGGYGSQFVCADITLPANSTGNVLPLVLDTHIVTMRALPYPWIIHTKLIQSSADGFARGLQVGPVAQLSDKFYIRTFSIDATGERCMAVVGDTSPISRTDDMIHWNTASFDGTSGRLCLTIPTADSLGNDTAVVLDIG